MKRKFFNSEFYHIYNRGVDKRKIYIDKSDYLRFIHDLYEFNDKNPAPQFSRAYNIEKLQKHQERVKYVGNEVPNIEKNEGEKKRDNRQKLVKIHSFALMPNHYHLLIEQIREDGITLFMKKMDGGYSRGFNEKHKRKGHLFESPFKSVYIKDDIHFGFLICYLHANVLDLWKKNWKEKKLSDQEINQALKFLEKYKWSSHLDYIGRKSFSSIINKEFLLDFFDGYKGYKEFFIDWLNQYQKNIKHIKDLTIH